VNEMSPERFCDWLQGFVEIQDSEYVTDKQWLIIKDHLKLVFDKKTPDRSINPPVKSIEEVLNEHFKKPRDISWKIGDSIPAMTC
jgi:hypothetical protein